MVEAAVRNFLGKTEHQIRESLRQTMEGHQRAIIGSMTVEQILQVNGSILIRS